MEYLTFGIILSVSIFFGILFFLWIRSRYREYDRKETLKENVIEMRAQIKMAQDYFRQKYDHNVYNNIKLNLDFCLKLILKKDIEDQYKYLEELYKSLYELGHRLQTRYDDVVYILAPLKNFREKLAEEFIDYLKKHSDEGL